eukprot:8132212-Alexandrium_andersonii.AAC.1
MCIRDRSEAGRRWPVGLWVCGREVCCRARASPLPASRPRGGSLSRLARWSRPGPSAMRSRRRAPPQAVPRPRRL